MPEQAVLTLYGASTWVIPLVVAITFHEASHGYVAQLFGDDTAWRLGRVPLARVEPYGIMILVGVLLILPVLGAQLGIDFSVVWLAIQRLTSMVISGILWLTGNR
jgi:hypothetical protein